MIFLRFRSAQAASNLLPPTGTVSYIIVGISSDTQVTHLDAAETYLVSSLKVGHLLFDLIIILAFAVEQHLLLLEHCLSRRTKDQIKTSVTHTGRRQGLVVIEYPENVAVTPIFVTTIRSYPRRSISERLLQKFTPLLPEHARQLTPP